MGVDFGEGENNLRDLIDWYASNVNEDTRNEATTRLHLIDRLLFECLGCNREEKRIQILSASSELLDMERRYTMAIENRPTNEIEVDRAGGGLVRSETQSSIPVNSSC